MPLIQAKPQHKKEQVRIHIDVELLAQIKKYNEWAEVIKLDDFFCQAAQFILAKDKEYQKYLDGKVNT